MNKNKQKMLTNSSWKSDDEPFFRQSIRFLDSLDEKESDLLERKYQDYKKRRKLIMLN